MDLGRSHRAGAGSPELVEPTFLATRRGPPERSRSGTRGFGLEHVAWSGVGTSLQPRILAVCVAGLVRLRMWRVGRHGFLQLRYNFSRVEAGGAGKRGSKLERTL